MHEPGASKILTVDDLYRLPDDERHHELVNGWLVSEPPPGARHGRVAARMAFALESYTRKTEAGFVVICESGFVLHRSPDTVRAPDLALIKTSRYHALDDSRAAIPGAPEVAIEILSPSNRPAEMHGKVADYLAAGSRLIWVIDPEREQVTEYRTLFEPRQSSLSDILTAADLLPGFSLRVRNIFGDQKD